MLLGTRQYFVLHGLIIVVLLRVLQRKMCLNCVAGDLSLFCFGSIEGQTACLTEWFVLRGTCNNSSVDTCCKER